MSVREAGVVAGTGTAPAPPGEGDASFRLLFAGIPLPMWVCDRETLAVLEVNEAAVAQYGYARDEFLRMRLVDLFPAGDEPQPPSGPAPPPGAHRAVRELRHRLKDGRVIDVEESWQDLDFAWRPVSLVVAQDISERKRLEADRARQSRHAAFRTEVSDALLDGGELDRTLQRCTEAMVRHLEAALARVWLLDEDGCTLELRASAGLSTHLDGAHGRVPVGRLKIGRIAEERRPHLTNALPSDPHVSDRNWARREGMVAFAGYPLVVEGRLVGVAAMFAREPLADDTIEALASAAVAIAQGVERKRAEERLSAERDLLQTVMDTVPHPIYVKDATSRFVRLNRALADFFGLADPADAIGKTDFDFFPESLARQYFADEQGVMASGQPILNKLEPQSEDEDAGAWFVTSTLPVRDPEGRIVGLVGSARDVTEERRAEGALREAEARYRTLVEQLPAAVYVLRADERGSPVYFSPQIEELLGYTVEELLARQNRWVDTVHPEDRERVLAEDARTDATGEPFRMEYRQRRKDGSYVWVRDECVPVRDDAGRLRFWQGVLLDVTDRKRADEALREAEARYRALVEQIPAATYIEAVDWDESRWQLRYVSPQIAAISGYGPDDWTRDPEFGPSLIHPDDRERILAEDARTDDTGEPFRVEYRLLAYDGRTVWVRDEAVLVRDDAGTPLYWLGFMLDISERKEAEAALRAAKEAAEAASRLKSEFLSTVTHELRTPMTSIQGYLELLLDGEVGPVPPEQREFLEVVHINARRLTALVSDVLDLARIEAGRLDLAIAPVDLATALKQVRVELTPQAAAKGLAFEVDVPAELPPALVDPYRLHQILLNLAGNAVKFTERGGVTLAARAGGGWVEVTVTDTGAGIPAEALPHIFEEFRQVDSSVTRRHGGTGLGLAIVKKLAELHGGSVAVESEVARGSTFTVRLPAVDKPPER